MSKLKADVLIQVRGRAVRRVAELREGVESAAADGVPVAVLTMRGEERPFVVLEPDR